MTYRIAFSSSMRCICYKHAVRLCVVLAALAFQFAMAEQVPQTPQHPVATQLRIDGVWQQGAIIRGQVTPGTHVQFLGKDVRVTPSGYFVVGLGRDAGPEAVLTVTAPSGEAQQHRFEVLQRDYQIQRVEGVQAKHVTPPASVLERIRAEAAQVYQARQTQGENLDFLQAFQWPVAGPITGVYGSQRFYNGEPRSPHYGVDIAAPTGTTVVAPASGVVTLVHDDMYYSGGTLIVDHGYGLSSTFIHLHKVLVEAGERVEQGQPIAEVGASGRATGPHLDWRMNWYDERLDPQLLMAAQGQSEPPRSAP